MYILHIYTKNKTVVENKVIPVHKIYQHYCYVFTG